MHAKRSHERKRQAGPNLAGRLGRAWEAVTTALALLTAIYLILNTIGATRTLLERYVVKLDGQLLAAIVAVMLEVVLIAIYQLGRQVRGVRDTVAAQTEDRIAYNVSEVLTTLDEIAERGRRRERSLDVLGLTLNTTWPQILAWLTSHDPPSHWRITLYYLDPDFLAECGELPADWAGESARSQERMREILLREAGEFAQRGIEVTLIPYACVPIVHGLRFGNGAMFLSYLQWSEAGKIRPFNFYERIPAGDTSVRASHYRDLLENWINRAAYRSSGEWNSDMAAAELD